MSVVWIQEHDYFGLGGYTGFDNQDNALVKEIIARKGSVDSESLQAYGQIGGTMGGYALCAAFVVTAPAAPLCGYLGGIIGGWLAKQVPFAHGSSTEDIVVDLWNNYTAPHVKSASKAMLSAKAYLTMRDLAITQGKTDAWLTSQGLPPAPILSRWAPNAQRYLGSKVYFSQPPGPIGKLSPEECNVAQKLGIIGGKTGLTCRDYYWIAFFNGKFGPIAAPGDPIDWWAVGRDEVAYGHVKKNGVCLTKGTAGTFDDMAYVSGVDASGNPTMVSEQGTIGCPKGYPSELMKEYIAKLNSLVQFQPVRFIARRTSSRGSGGASPVLVIGGLAAAAAAAWYFLL